jgi:hypothetical protein
MQPVEQIRMETLHWGLEVGLDSRQLGSVIQVNQMGPGFGFGF